MPRKTQPVKRRSAKTDRSLPLRRLEDRVALITGGGSGIGLAIAHALAREGASVILVGRDDRKLHTAAAAITRGGGNATAHVCDVTDEESIDGLFAALRKHFGSLDILVNNAGVAHPSHHVDRLSTEEWRNVLDTNLTGAFLVTRSALAMMRGGGTIVNNISVAATVPFTGMSAYSASKAGLLAFTNTLREELRGRGIRVIALIPGATDTTIWKQFWAGAPRDRMMSAATVAEVLLAAVCLPENATLQELTVSPTLGRL